MLSHANFNPTVSPRSFLLGGWRLNEWHSNMMQWHLSPSSIASHSCTTSRGLRDDSEWDSDDETPYEDSSVKNLHAPVGANTNSATRNYEEEEERLRQLDARSRRIRTVVCVGLCTFTGVTLLVLLGLVATRESAPKQQAMDLLRKIHTSSLIQFTISPKLRVVHGMYGRTRTETVDFFGFTSISGQLIPHIDAGIDPKRTTFNGWISVQRLIEPAYDILLSDHRGYRVMKQADTTMSTGRCLTHDEFVPLHDLHSPASRAFTATDYGTFQLNCSRTPIEFVFARLPFVFCPEDFMLKTFTPTLGRQPLASFRSESIVIHGEQMRIDLELVRGAERLQIEGQSSIPWLQVVGELASNCPFLEAPLTTFKPRTTSILDTILTPGKGAAPSHTKKSGSSLRVATVKTSAAADSGTYSPTESP